LKSNSDKIFLILRLFGYSAAIIFLYTIPWETLSQGPVICLYKKFFNINCIGCGMTRASWQLAHLNIKEAIRFNPLSVVLFPLWIFIMVYDLFLFLKFFLHSKTGSKHFQIQER